MTENQDFDNIIKSKFSEQEFPFDEANWDEAEDMIYAFRKRERIKRVAFIFSAGLILGILIMLPFVVIKHEEIGAPAIIKDDNIAANTTQQNKSGKNNLGSDETAETSLNENEAKVDVANMKSVSSATVKPNNNVAMLANKGKVESKTSLTNATSQAVDKKETALEKNIESATELPQTTSDSITTPLSELAANNLQVAKDSVIAMDSLTVINDSLIVAADTVLAADSTNSVTDKADSTKNNNLSRRIFIEAYVGGNYVREFGFNSFQGITVYFPLINNFSIGTGAGYTFLSASSNTVKTIVTDITYDLGYTSDVTEIKTDKIHYFMLPLHIQYNIDEKSALLIGAVNYFMTTVSNTYSTYKESYGDKDNVNSQKTYGYSSGINNYDVGLIVGCKRTLFNNLGIAAYFNYGLVDIKKDAYYNDSRFDRNISAQLMLTYKLR